MKNTLRDAVIFDVDGTLCDTSGIRHLIPDKPVKERSDYDAFHQASIDCPPIRVVLDAAHRVKREGVGLVVATARGAKHQDVTVRWLRKHGVEFDDIHMRPDGDERRDVVVKKDLLARIRTAWNPIHAWDDNPFIVEMFRMEGVMCTVVPGWAACGIQLSRV